MKPTNFKISKAQPRHLDRIMDIENSVFSEPWSRGQFEAKMTDESAVFFVAEKGGKVLGYAVAQLFLDEGEIYNIAVAPNVRQRHIGTALMRYIMNYGKNDGVRRFHLEVRAGNLPAIRMYWKNGFGAVGIRKGYYRNPEEDAILMTYKEESK